VTQAQAQAANYVADATTAEERVTLLDDCQAEYAWQLQHGTLAEAVEAGELLAAVRALVA
jgi:hypothetical protein